MSSAARFWTSTPQGKPVRFPPDAGLPYLWLPPYQGPAPLRMTLELDKVGMERLEAEAAWENIRASGILARRPQALIGQTQTYGWAKPLPGTRSSPAKLSSRSNPTKPLSLR